MMQYQRKSVLLASASENFITPITKERHIETWTRTNCWLAADAQEVLYTGFVHNTKLQFDAILVICNADIYIYRQAAQVPVINRAGHLREWS